MANRRDALLDAAIDLLGRSGIHGLTHRAVDVAAGLPGGSASNHFRTRDALLNAVAERFAARERANWEDLATTMYPAHASRSWRSALAGFAQDAAGPDRTLALARYAILVEAGELARRCGTQLTGDRQVGSPPGSPNWVRIAGSADPGRDAPIIMNHWTGIVLHAAGHPRPGVRPAARRSRRW